MNSEPADNASEIVDDPRAPWIPPAVQAMRAGDAEAGPIPVNPEGAFGTGS